MKFFTPEGGELIEIMTVATEGDNVAIRGKIMGAMPMTAILKPDQLRQGFKFLTPRLFFTLIAMLFRRSKR
jgi:hypothetical protein